MKKIIYLSILTVFFANCTKQEFKHPKILPSYYDTLIVNNFKFMQNSKSLIFKINVPIDGIVDLKIPKDINAYNEQNFFAFSEFAYSKTDSLIIFVDDKNNKFHSDLYLDSFLLPPPPPPQEFQDNFDEDATHYVLNKSKITHYETFPFYIQNISSKNIEIEMPIAGGDLFMILEAKNKENQWKPIEFFEQFGFLCGTGHQNYLLKPNHFIVGGVIKYDGDYTTEMRVKFRVFEKILYSNSFKGKINYSQFYSDSITKFIKDRFSYKTEQSLRMKLDNMFLN